MVVAQTALAFRPVWNPVLREKPLSEPP